MIHMDVNIIKNKSFRFSIDVVQTCQYLVKEKKEFVLSRQFLRSGTSIGAMVRESIYAESTSDFIHKLSIALKEANETEYWILLMKETHYIGNDQIRSLSNDIIEIKKILTAIILSSKKKLRKSENME